MPNRHLGKLSVAKEARYRGLGSMAILGGAMHTAFLLASDPDDAALRVLACTKNNLAAFPPALAFHLAATSDGVPRIEWQGAVHRTAYDLVAAGQRPGEAVPRAISVLQQNLAHGPCNRETLLGKALRQGISLRTLERAKAELAVRSEQRREEGGMFRIGRWRRRKRRRCSGPNTG